MGKEQWGTEEGREAELLTTCQALCRDLEKWVCVPAPGTMLGSYHRLARLVLLATLLGLRFYPLAEETGSERLRT